jgi:hypothetical protein
VLPRQAATALTAALLPPLPPRCRQAAAAAAKLFATAMLPPLPLPPCRHATPLLLRWGVHVQNSKKSEL